ncbi:MAG: ankyrin repeat domain-containing protein [Marinilabilia sp.]
MKIHKTGLLILTLTGLLGCQSPKSGKNQESGEAMQKKETGSQEPQPSISFHEAAMTGNIDAVNAYIKNGSDIEVTNKDGHTPLMLAAYNGHSDIVEKLLKKGADINKTDNKNLTSLHFAASGPFPETVKLLLQHGADVNAIDDIEGFTPLMYAAAEGNAEVAKILLGNEADPSLTDEDGDDAQTFARQNNHQEIAEILEMD